MSPRRACPARRFGEESSVLPEYRREVYISSYANGWALYWSGSGRDGMYDTPYTTASCMLTFQMWRAPPRGWWSDKTASTTKGWTRAPAMRLPGNDNTGSGPTTTSRSMSNRYSPGQGAGAQLTNLSMRPSVDVPSTRPRRLWGRVRQSALPHAVLALGAVPLPVLRARNRAVQSPRAGRAPMPVTWQRPPSPHVLATSTDILAAVFFRLIGSKPAFLLSDGAAVSYGNLRPAARRWRAI